MFRLEEARFALADGTHAPDWYGADLPEDRLSQFIPDVFTLETPLKIMLYTRRPQADGTDLVVCQAAPGNCFRFVNRSGNGPDFSKVDKFHRHNFYELMYVAEGRVYQNIEHQRHVYPPGSACLFNRNVYHAEERQGAYTLVFLQFRPDVILEVLNQPTVFSQTRDKAYRAMESFFRHDITRDPAADKKYLDFIPLREDCHEIQQPMEQMFDLFLAPDAGGDFYLRGLLTSLLCRLFDPAAFRQTPIHLGRTAEQDLFHAITQYLTGHHHASRRELEQHFSYSGDYLYKTVRKFTGLSLCAYRTKLCMEEAAALLAKTDRSIGDIILELGFANHTSFYKHFYSLYRMTPKEYRRSHRG